MLLINILVLIKRYLFLLLLPYIYYNSFPLFLYILLILIVIKFEEVNFNNSGKPKKVGSVKTKTFTLKFFNMSLNSKV